MKEFESLRIHSSMLDGEPIMEWVETELGSGLWVCVHGWCMPVKFWHMMCMWCMMNGRAYANRMDMITWTSVLLPANVNHVCLNSGNVQHNDVCEIMFTDLINWSVKKDAHVKFISWFGEILNHIQECEHHHM
jgi:hypothetical protein